jgi:hypothetical protein
VQYSMIPTLKFPGGSAELSLWAVQGTLRWFPFSGAFYLGSGVGYQSLKASVSSTSGVAPTEVSTNLSSPFITPQLGWLWMWKSGFALGLNAGVQIPFASDPEVKMTVAGVPVPAAGGDADDVRNVAKMIGKTPFPNIDLLKIGFFF